jgi:radical SAM-linked protein
MADARRVRRHAEEETDRCPASLADSDAVRYLLEFSRRGPARYISHLDTARALQRTLVRAGFELGLTHGMRPKPRLALGLPLPVGAAGCCELAVVDIAAEPAGATAEGMLAGLRTATPPGLTVAAFALCAPHLRLRPRLAVYEWQVDVAARLLAVAAARFAAAVCVPYARRSPKGERTLDLRHYVDAVEVEQVDGGARVRFAVRHRSDGAARPAEVLAQLLEWSGGEGFAGAPRLTMPGAPGDEEADERAQGATGEATGTQAGNTPARVVNAALTRLGVVYDGLAPCGPAQEWLERHATETKAEGRPAGGRDHGGRTG